MRCLFKGVWNSQGHTDKVYDSFFLVRETEINYKMEIGRLTEMTLTSFYAFGLMVMWNFWGPCKTKTRFSRIFLSCRDPKELISCFYIVMLLLCSVFLLSSLWDPLFSLPPIVWWDFLLSQRSLNQLIVSTRRQDHVATLASNDVVNSRDDVV